MAETENGVTAHLFVFVPCQARTILLGKQPVLGIQSDSDYRAFKVIGPIKPQRLLSFLDGRFFVIAVMVV